MQESVARVQRSGVEGLEVVVSKLSVRHAVVLAAAVATSSAAAPAAGAQDEAKRTYTAARITGAPPVIDGRADEGCWERVGWSGDFTQSTPRDGAEPTQETAFKVLYDADNLYMLVRLYDTEPAFVERRLGRRDAYSGDDVYVQIDSYFDRWTAFGFGVNAAGVKYDAVISADGASEDSSWDPVWFVATSVDQKGWTWRPQTWSPFSPKRSSLTGSTFRSGRPGSSAGTVSCTGLILRTQMASPRFFQRPDATYLSLDPARTSLSGHGGSIEAGRSGNSRLILNGSYAWRSPGLELNDVGFQRVADYAVARVQGTYRMLQPFSIFRRFSVEFAPWVNLVNMHEFVGMGGYVAPSAQFRNYWTVTAVCERDTEYLDTMVLRGGPALKVSPYTSVFFALNSDGRKRATFGVNAQHRWDANREVDSTSLGVTLGYRPSGAFDVSIQPNVSVNRASLQYVGTRQVGSENRYLVSSLDQKTLRVTVRLNYSLTPTLSLQYYGQPFVSAGTYSDLKRITDPRAARYEDRFHLFSAAEIALAGGQYLVDENHDGVTDFSFGRPDFNFRQFRSNLVARWEYSPGSTLYVVWAQDRTGADASGAFSAGHDMRELFRVAPRNVFLVKFSRRIAF